MDDRDNTENKEHMDDRYNIKDKEYMEDGEQTQGFLVTLCNVYFVFLLVILPLYVGRGYEGLGETKYQLFRNVSFICVGLFMVVGGLHLARDIYSKSTASGSESLYPVCLQAHGPKTVEHNHVLYWVLAYGIWNLVSAVCSKFQNIAWTGYEEWYMGALTQCLLVGIYLMALWFGRQSERKPLDRRILTILSMGTLEAITVLGLLQMLNPDVLGLLKHYGNSDWATGHMLSTLGNINWLCGFYSVLYAWSMSFYLQEKRKSMTVLSGFLNVTVTALLLIQGSDGGLLLVAVAAFIGLSLSSCPGNTGRAQFEKLLFLGIGSSLLLILWKTLAEICNTVDIMFSDGYARVILLWKGWLLVALAFFLAWLVHRRLPSGQALLMRRCLLGMMGVLGLAAAACVLWKIRDIPFSQWGNYRGRLWQMSWEGFLQGDWTQKLLGAGPDCFAPYLNQASPEATVLFRTGHFAGSVFTNAHNEWLTLLINIGIPGVVCYAGIFISAFRRYRGKAPAMFLLGLYGIYSLVSFQQVLNAPFFFLLLGLCETNNFFESIGK